MISQFAGAEYVKGNGCPRTLDPRVRCKISAKAHPWRRCPAGMHFVREHEAHIPSTPECPGEISIVRPHFARNSSGKEELNHDEIKYISKTYFDALIGSPTAGVLKFGGVDADAYDKEIRGWTQYWNDIFREKEPEALDSNLVKSLIATESGFRLDPKENKTARGLMQIMHSTRLYLQDPHGELSDHLVRLSVDELLDPSSNICAGIR